MTDPAAACATKSGESVTTRLEKRFVARVLPRIPGWCQTYHLTAMTIVWGLANIGFAVAATRDLRWLLGVAAMIVLQYLTDLFDGAVGRSRDTGLVRWGFYADHLLDFFFTGTLVAAGAIISPPDLAFWWLGLMVVALGFMASSFLAFGATQKFEIYHYGLGPTELRGVFIAVIVGVVLTGTGHFWWTVPTATIACGVTLVVFCIRTAAGLWQQDMDAKAARTEVMD